MPKIWNIKCCTNNILSTLDVSMNDVHPGSQPINESTLSDTNAKTSPIVGTEGPTPAASIHYMPLYFTLIITLFYPSYMHTCY